MSTRDMRKAFKCGFDLIRKVKDSIEKGKEVKPVPPGRSKKTNERVKRNIKKLSLDDPTMSCHEIAKKVSPLVGDDDTISPETVFCLGPDKRWGWRLRGHDTPRCFLRKPNFPICDADFLKKSVTGIYYRRITGYPRGFQFQQDGAPAHTFKKTMNFFKEQGVDVLPNWPAFSPDLSPIEHLWGIMKQELRKKKPKSINDLKKTIKEVWDSIKQTRIN
ncbi:Tc1-like transposase DDE domain-containing protein [Entamoeba marina]